MITISTISAAPSKEGGSSGWVRAAWCVPALSCLCPWGHSSANPARTGFEEQMAIL